MSVTCFSSTHSIWFSLVFPLSISLSVFYSSFLKLLSLCLSLEFNLCLCFNENKIVFMWEFSSRQKRGGGRVKEECKFKKIWAWIFVYANKFRIFNLSDVSTSRVCAFESSFVIINNWLCGTSEMNITLEIIFISEQKIMTVMNFIIFIIWLFVVIYK